MGSAVPRIGIHVSLWTRSWTDEFLAHITTAIRLGFDAVEIPLMDPSTVPVKAIRALCEDRGLPVYCGTGLNPSLDISSSDAGIRERGKAHLLHCVEIAAELHSPTLEGVIHSPWGLNTPVTDQQWKRSADVLHQVAERAVRSGVKLGLECLNRYESSFLNTVAQGKALLGLISHPGVGIHLDTYHMNLEETDIPLALRDAGANLVFMHLSENTRGFPGSGSLPWAGIIDALRGISYDGPVVIESYIMPNCPAGNDVRIWRPIEAEADASLKRSLAFLKDLWRTRSNHEQ